MLILGMQASNKLARNKRKATRHERSFASPQVTSSQLLQQGLRLIRKLKVFTRVKTQFLFLTSNGILNG